VKWFRRCLGRETIGHFDEAIFLIERRSPETMADQHARQ